VGGSVLLAVVYPCRVNGANRRDAPSPFQHNARRPPTAGRLFGGHAGPAARSWKRAPPSAPVRAGLTIGPVLPRSCRDSAAAVPLRRHDTVVLGTWRVEDDPL
jgi:hypothetical protein